MKTSNVNCSALAQVDPNNTGINATNNTAPRQIKQLQAPQTVSTTPRQNKLHPMQKALVSQIQKEAGAKECATPQGSTDEAASSKFNLQRIASNAFLGGLSIGPTFGAATAINNYVRSRQKLSPTIKIAASFGPMLAGVASSIVAEGIRKVFDIKSTGLEKESLTRDAATPASFIAISSMYGYALLTKKFVPRNASLMTMAIATLGSSIGSALSEAVGQKLPESANNISPPTHQNPTALQVGIGRSITQIPTVFFNKLNAAHIMTTGSLPSMLTKPTIFAAAAYPLVVGIPFIGRKSVTPSTLKTSEQASSVKE